MIADRAAEVIARACRVNEEGGWKIPSHPEALRGRDGIEADLARALYQGFHLRQGPMALPEGRIPVLSEYQDKEFVHLLRAANQFRGHWSPGWRMLGEDRVTNGSIILTVPAEKRRGGGPWQEVYLPSERSNRSAGYFMTISDSGPPRDASGLLRVYFNLTATAAARFLRRITMYLRDAHVAAILKVLNNPRAFGRTDACVLYLDRQEWEKVRATILQRVVDLDRRPQVSVFARKLTAGVAYAFEQATENGRVLQSFGERASRAAARAIVAAARTNSEPARTERIATELRRVLTET